MINLRIEYLCGFYARKRNYICKKNSLKRQEHKLTVRTKILKVARRLLLEQGYNKTTIRQIVKECDIKIGTVYHYFKNKEEIFLNVVLSLVDRVAVIVDDSIDENDVALRMAKEFKMHIDIILDDEKSRELYLVAYQSPTISELILKKRVERLKVLFSRQDQRFRRPEYISSSLYFKGILQAIAVERHNSTKEEMEKYIPIIIKDVLGIYKFSESEIEKTMKKL